MQIAGSGRSAGFPAAILDSPCMGLFISFSTWISCGYICSQVLWFSDKQVMLQCSINWLTFDWALKYAGNMGLASGESMYEFVNARRTLRWTTISSFASYCFEYYFPTGLVVLLRVVVSWCWHTTRKNVVQSWCEVTMWVLILDDSISSWCKVILSNQFDKVCKKKSWTTTCWNK